MADDRSTSQVPLLVAPSLLPLPEGHDIGVFLLADQSAGDRLCEYSGAALTAKDERYRRRREDGPDDPCMASEARVTLGDGKELAVVR